MNEKVVYCQIDAHLDSNPKIRRGGRDARDVFEFLLRRVAIGRTQGTVPLKYIEPWYLADQLMMSEDEARHGTSQAVTVRLIEIDATAGVVRIVGWSDEWGRRPKEGRERTAAWRARKANQSETHHGVTDCDVTKRSVTESDASDVGDVGEERRGEEDLSEAGASGSDPSPAATAALEFALAAVGEINRLASRQYKPETYAADCRKLVKAKFTAEQAVRVVRSKASWLQQPAMAEHFCPKTILRKSNFAKYLDELDSKRQPQLRIAASDDEPDLTYAGFGMGTTP